MSVFILAFNLYYLLYHQTLRETLSLTFQADSGRKNNYQKNKDKKDMLSLLSHTGVAGLQKLLSNVVRPLTRKYKRTRQLIVLKKKALY